MGYLLGVETQETTRVEEPRTLSSTTLSRSPDHHQPLLTALASRSWSLTTNSSLLSSGPKLMAFILMPMFHTLTKRTRFFSPTPLMPLAPPSMELLPQEPCSSENSRLRPTF